jgi:hypothetical protein
MTISLDELAELAAAPCTQPWWNEMELRKGARHRGGDAAFIAACDPGTVLKLLAVVREAQEVKEHEYGHLAQQSRARANLFTALAALESTP